MKKYEIIPRGEPQSELPTSAERIVKPGYIRGSNMSIPTKSEEYSKLIEYLRKAQESCAMLAHLNNADGDKMGGLLATGWLGISEILKKIIHEVTQLAMGRLN